MDVFTIWLVFSEISNNLLDVHFYTIVNFTFYASTPLFVIVGNFFHAKTLSHSILLLYRTFTRLKGRNYYPMLGFYLLGASFTWAAPGRATGGNE